MYKDKRIPSLAIPRLSLYYRAIFDRKQDASIISSEELASLTGVTAAQVRRDLTYFGQFGTPGRGYDINGLKSSLLKILGTDRSWNVALVGVGNLGTAFLAYNGFKKQGFNIVCAFDDDLRKIGKMFEQVRVQDISELEQTIISKEVRIAIVTVPVSSAEKVIDLLVSSGIKAILNFTPFKPQIENSTQILNIDLSIELERLAYFLTKGQEIETFFI